MPHPKAQIHQALIQFLQARIDEAVRDYALAKESRDSDTKSSAGDKFETGREMMQREMDKLSASIDVFKSHLVKIKTIDTDKKFAKIGFGSIVETDTGTYYMSVGLGKLSSDGVEFYTISNDSPLGELLMHKQAGEQIDLRGRIIHIKSVS